VLAIIGADILGLSTGSLKWYALYGHTDCTGCTAYSLYRLRGRYRLTVQTEHNVMYTVQNEQTVQSVQSVQYTMAAQEACLQALQVYVV
jgi:hypothetical protein